MHQSLHTTLAKELRQKDDLKDAWEELRCHLSEDEDLWPLVSRNWVNDAVRLMFPV